MCDFDGLASLGWDSIRQMELQDGPEDGLVPARVIAAVKGRYLVRGVGIGSEVWARRRGRAFAGDAVAETTPVVGDWSLVRPAETPLIERLMTRRTSFVRRAAGRRAKPQVLAANLDRVFVVTDVDQDFNPRRLERYLAAVWDSGAEPVIVLNKTDLPHDPARLDEVLEQVAAGVSVVRTSATEADGLNELLTFCPRGLTVALVGSSGVGKSTIVNALLGRAQQAVGEVRAGDAKGRHTTTRQELVETPLGALLIDTPGMRELGLWQAEQGLGQAFDDIATLAQGCRFADCAHRDEPGCAVVKAAEEGLLDPDRLESYGRLQREIAHQSERGSNSKKRWKQINKDGRNAYHLWSKLGLKGK